MTAKILRFKPKNPVTRLQALGFLNTNNIEFPEKIDGFIGKDLFFGWRFVQANDDIVYFANGIEAGISKEELCLFNFLNEASHVAS